MPKFAYATGSACASLFVALVLFLFGGPLGAPALGQGEARFQRDATAMDGGSPRIDRLSPSAAVPIVDKVGLEVVEIGFDRQIAIPPIESIRVWGVRSGPIGFERVYDPRARVLRLVLEGAPRDDLITIVLDDRVTAPLGTPMDGELASQTSPLLPSGDGLPGGVAVLRYRVLQGDANRDGVVDLQDQLVILDSLDKVAGQPGFDPRADLNGDGAVNLFDLLIWQEAAGLGLRLPVPDADPPALIALDPPAGLFDAPIAQVRATFDKELAPQHVGPRALHATDRLGVVRWPASVEFEGDALRFAFDPLLEACNRYTIGLSGALADASGALLVPVSPRPVYDALVPPPAPTIDPPTSPTTALLARLTGQAERAVEVEATGPGGTVRVPVVGGAFALDAPLRADSVNTIFVTSISACGVRSAPTTTRVVMDTQPPTLHIDFPAGGVEVTIGMVTVAGRVGDTLSGFMGLAVTVNGIEAIVDPGIGTNGTFEARGVTLGPVGQPTRLEAVATDALGNRATRAITITRVEIPPGTPSMAVVGGADQTGPVGRELPEPVEVLVLRGDGSPFAGKVVTFDVTRSDGRLSDTPGGPGGPGALTLQVAAGSDGVARAWWTLGADAGCGNNRIAATSRDIAGTTLFCASADPGPASRINVGSGSNQVGQAGATLAQPFVAWLSDGANPVRDQPVTFAVVQGDGAFAGGREVVVLTDGAGRAAVEFAPGQTPGMNVVQARFDGMAGLPANFTARGIARSDTRPTTFDGLVLDNTGRPIGGAEVVLVVNGVFLEPVFTDVAGRYEIPDMPQAGPAELFVDALVATTLAGEPIDPGSFPTMHLKDFVVVQGAANALAMPVALPELNPANARLYDGTEDVVLTVEGVEGVEFTIRAGSMTLADGTRPGPGRPAVVALNQVHFDEVPMPLPDGVAVPFTWTLQPSGAAFDPPVEVSMPNFTGEPAGASTFLISFNHDTGRFDIVGTATVDSQGASIRSDAGSGIPIAGWGAPRPPPPPVGNAAGDPTCEGTGDPCCPRTNPNGLLWEVMRAVGRFAVRLTGLLTGFSDVVDCGLGIADSIEVCGDAYIELRVLLATGREPGPEDVARVLDCANNLKSTAVSCLEILNRVPDPATLAQEISAFLNSIQANLDFYTSTECLADPTKIAILGFVQRGIGLLDRAVNLADDFSSRRVWLALACTLSEEIVTLLRRDDPLEDLIARLDQIFETLDTTAADIVNLDARMLASITEMDATGGEMLGDARFILEDIGNPRLVGSTVTAAGRVTTANEFGGFVLRNIPVTTELQRLVATTDVDGNRLYAVSEFFNVQRDGTLFPGGFAALLPALPATPRRLEARADSPVLEPGQQTQVTITGAMSDGTVADLTPRDEGTTYRTSNPAIATVGQDGLVTATGLGTAFITASNQGVSGVRRIFVTRETAPTRVEGFVVGPDGGPVPDALVTLLVFGGEASTSADGAFAIDATLPGEGGTITLVATATIDGQRFTGTSEGIPAVLGGLTDAGVIVLSPLCENPVWVEGFGVPGMNGFWIACLSVYDDGSGPDLYAGGDFTTAGGISASRIAKWDGVAWTRLRSGMNNPVVALTVFDDGSGPALYAGGDFTTAGGVTANRIARWDGSAWTRLGSGMNNTVNALTVFDDGSGPALYAGGDFTTAGGVATNNIARWDGSVWTPLGSGMNGRVQALTVFDDGSGPALYAGGVFTTAGGVAVGGIARWDGVAWSRVGLASSGGGVYALTTFNDGSGQALYIGGLFGSFGGSSARGIAKWDGVNWSVVGTGQTSGWFRALTVFDDGSGPALVAGGLFVVIGGVSANSIARWDGSAWTRLGSGMNDTVLALTVFDDGSGPALFAGGNFTTAGGVTANRIAKWGCEPLGVRGGPGVRPGGPLAAPGFGTYVDPRQPTVTPRSNRVGLNRANPPGGGDGGPLLDHTNNALLDPNAPLDPDALLGFIEDLGTVGSVEPGTLEIQPVNGAGMSTGALETALGRYLPYRATPTPDGPLTDLLGLLPEHDPSAIPGGVGHGWGLSIDDHGRVVGVSAAIGPGGEDVRAVLWTPTEGPIDLGALLPDGSGWQLHEAVAFDDAARIVGVGTHEGRQRAFRLTLRARPPRGDLDGDGRVDTFDMLAMLAAMERGDPSRAPGADLNGDGAIDLLDAALLVELLSAGGGR